MLEFFFAKAGEMLAEYALHTVRGINDFPRILDSLQTNLQSLSAKAADVKEQIKTGELGGKKKRKREVENWLTEVQNIESKLLSLEIEVQSQGFISRFFVGGEAEKLKERVDELIEQSRYFGELVLDESEIRGEPLLTTKLFGKAFEKNLKRIWKQLVTDKVWSMGIYGMGGVGKTTLTKHIHNQLLEKTRQSVFWVTVSQECSVRMLQNKIVHAMDVKNLFSDEDNEERRAARLHQALSERKNVVLILDDVWEDISLERVGYPLRVEGRQLIITTRSLKVCRQMDCQVDIPVESLDTDEAWDLFGETLGRRTGLTPNEEEIAKSMVEFCDGLPLGIITLAGSMRGETAIHVWRNAREELQKSSLGHDDMHDKVFKVLKYSFDQLDKDHQKQGENDGYTDLQLCFLYCSLYPEDARIERAELVRKFITEELVDKRRSMKAQLDQGHSMLDKLVNVCLLEDVGGNYVKMHDLVRAMALKITEGKTKVIAGNFNRSLKEILDEVEWKYVEKMSLIESGIKEFPAGMSPDCPKLSTLLLQWNTQLKFIADSFFWRTHGLCTLDLEGTGIKELPNSLSDLESLKALLLGWCQELVYVPNLGKLKALKELDLSYTAIKEVPQGMEQLINLKLLSMIGAYHLKMFPTGLLPNLTKLQLLRLPSQIQAPIEDIERLEQLEGFVGRVKDVCDFNRFITSQQSKGDNAFYFTIVGEDRFSRNYHNHVKRTSEGFVDNKLFLHVCSLEQDEEKKVTLLADNIQHLEIRNCEGLSSCLLDDILSNSKPLKNLTISNCEGMEYIMTNEQLLMAPQVQLHSPLFPNLEEISLEGMRNFMGAIQTGTGAAASLLLSSPSPTTPRQVAVFPSLRRLDIFKCKKVKKLGLSVSDFPNLEYLSVKWCSEIEEIIQVSSLADNYGRSGDDQGQLASLQLVSFPKLKVLILQGLRRLKSICKATMICDSLVSITLKKCRELKKLPLYFAGRRDGQLPDASSSSSSHSSYSPPPALKEIILYKEEKEWWESLEWDHPDHKHLLQPLLYEVDVDRADLLRVKDVLESLVKWGLRNH